MLAPTYRVMRFYVGSDAQSQDPRARARPEALQAEGLEAVSVRTRTTTNTIARTALGRGHLTILVVQLRSLLADSGEGAYGHP